MRAEVRQAQAEDIPRIAERMRAADRAEIAASHGHTPEQALSLSLAASTAAWTGWVDDEPACMFGVGPIAILAGRGAPWMLGTEVLDDMPWPFVRQEFMPRCRESVKAMLAVYPMLENYVDDRNTSSKNWLRHLGFALAVEPVTLPSGVNFRHFAMQGGRAHV